MFKDACHSSKKINDVPRFARGIKSKINSFEEANKPLSDRRKKLIEDMNDIDPSMVKDFEEYLADKGI